MSDSSAISSPSFASDPRPLKITVQLVIASRRTGGARSRSASEVAFWSLRRADTTSSRCLSTFRSPKAMSAQI
jgi:hypothetical protein